MAKSERLTLEELTALNDEIIMLSRANIPIESGLRAFAKSGGSRANEVAGRIADRLEAGQSLTDSITNAGGQLPQLYQTVVESGVRSGHLPVTLEAISEYTRDLSELRRDLGQAIVYPLIAVMGAYGLFLVFVLSGIRRIVDVMGGIDDQTGAGMKAVFWLSENPVTWAWIPPAILMLGVIAWLGGSSAGSLSLSGTSRLLHLLPGMTVAVRCYRHSLFARMTTVLLQNDVPFHDAITLASGGCGGRLQNAALALAKADERGDRSSVSDREVGAIRPLLRWILLREQPASQLIRNLKTVASTYYDKGQMTLRWIRFITPIGFTLFVGGGVVLGYCLALFLPLTEMLRRIAEGAI